jgi:hypothetical protein
MTQTDWEKWVAHHSTLFDLRGVSDMDLIALWQELLAGYTLAEMIEASNWLALNESAAYRTRHADLLGQRIRSVRADSFRRRRALQDAECEAICCEICRDDGLVTVPHLRAVVDGEWQRPFYTMAVGCVCQRGRRALDRMWSAAQQGDKTWRMLALEVYEASVAGWRTLIEARGSALVALGRERWAAGEAQRLGRPIELEAVRRRLAESFGVH